MTFKLVFIEGHAFLEKEVVVKYIKYNKNTIGPI